jgi:phosphoenolpyruvate-protein kinase (PTS system EI component)
MTTKQASTYIAIITTTAGIAWGAALYTSKKEITDTTQDKTLQEIYKQQSIIITEVREMNDTVKFLKKENTRYRCDIRILAGSLERHILRDEKTTREVFQELKQLYPMLNYNYRPAMVPFDIQSKNVALKNTDK